MNNTFPAESDRQRDSLFPSVTPREPVVVVMVVPVPRARTYVFQPGNYVLRMLNIANGRARARERARIPVSFLLRLRHARRARSRFASRLVSSRRDRENILSSGISHDSICANRGPATPANRDDRAPKKARRRIDYTRILLFNFRETF